MEFEYFKSNIQMLYFHLNCRSQPNLPKIFHKPHIKCFKPPDQPNLLLYQYKLKVNKLHVIISSKKEIWETILWSIKETFVSRNTRESSQQIINQSNFIFGFIRHKFLPDECGLKWFVDHFLQKRSLRVILS